MNLFHFSDTSRLPWIMSSGELRPGGNKAGGFPSPEFVWATTNLLGDASASVAGGDPYITGKVRHVRFTFDSALFTPWSEIPDHYPQWTPDQVRRLESYTEGASDPKTWWCSPRPIQREDWSTIHSRSYRDNRWQVLSPTSEIARMADEHGMTWLGVEVVGRPFVSAKVTAPDGRTGYAGR
ncbi:hypothetical protein D3273_24605 [Lichenibacterium minor]|uniref:Uncharacterized protein n=1 Tax=Lichenibacterium minor TaxID=2316528 RepID=A0A4Q2U3I7_9HYPH|nr:hypothetical protein [Lichenibacterium minor]RYC29295.1 hypothetical protein D3273_24605 [Lichenibacterium minor]